MARKTSADNRPAARPWCWKRLAASALVAGIGAICYTAFSPTEDALSDRANSDGHLNHVSTDSLSVAEIRSLLLNPRTGTQVLINCGEDSFRKGIIDLAEKCFRKALESGDESARLPLGNLLYSTGRIYAARKCWEPLLFSGGIDLLSLPRFGSDALIRRKFHQSRKSGQHESEAERQRTLCAVGYALLASGDVQAAHDLLAAIATTGIEDRQFQTLWARCLFAIGESDALLNWIKRLHRSGVPNDPEYFVIEGRVLRARGLHSEAVHCFKQAFELNPNDYTACAQLGEVLEVTGETRIAELFRSRARMIGRYAKLTQDIDRDAELPTRHILEAVIKVCHALDAAREGVAWCTIAQAIDPESEWMLPHATALQSIMSGTDGRFVKQSELFAWHQDSAHLRPNWKELTDPRAAALNSSPEVEFADVAKFVGLDFIYENGRDAASERRFFEFTGGGVAAIDFDADAWPDLFFTQGGTAPDLGRSETRSVASPEIYSDKLFRNIRGVSSRDASIVSGLVDRGYSQGCSSGDFNLDGFHDLYVANIGANQFFLNNGDGTFTEQQLTNDIKWTTSCAIADLTGDGIPDIYDVNHVQPAGVCAAMCFKGDATFPCDMSRMHPETDTLLSGDGDGTTTDISQQAGIALPNGIGLGLSIGDFDHASRLSIFVANDARPNFLLQRSASQNKFEDVAAQKGLALSASGKSQACMGIAVGDINGDEYLDFCVTNFFDDYNTVYRQGPPSFFSDTTAESRLIAPSQYQLGFGCQFLDADVNGTLDLVLTNGDVDDFSSARSDRPFQQRSQFFRNASGHFSLDTAGDYFERPVLGRGLALLDWNRDQKMDFAVSHIGSSAALLLNVTKQTTAVGVTIVPVGTTSTRIPFGISVSYNRNGREQYRQLTAGCGYQAFNQPLLSLAVRKTEFPISLTGKFLKSSVETSVIPASGEWKWLEAKSLFQIPE